MEPLSFYTKHIQYTIVNKGGIWESNWGLLSLSLSLVITTLDDHDSATSKVDPSDKQATTTWS